MRKMWRVEMGQLLASKSLRSIAAFDWADEKQDGGSGGTSSPRSREGRGLRLFSGYGAWYGMITPAA